MAEKVLVVYEKGIGLGHWAFDLVMDPVELTIVPSVSFVSLVPGSIGISVSLQSICHTPPRRKHEVKLHGYRSNFIGCPSVTPRQGGNTR
ncbi:hypothetical protein Tco_0736748 [Tanacetum coccineum]